MKQKAELLAGKDAGGAVLFEKDTRKTALTPCDCRKGSNSEQSCVNWGLNLSSFEWGVELLWATEGGGSKGRFDANSHGLPVPTGGS